MSEFKPAFTYTMTWEDSNPSGEVTQDAGGRTRFGIAEVFNKDMPGDFWTAPTAQAILMAQSQYKRNYFDVHHLDLILNQEVCSYVFDCIVNPGASFIKQIQQSAVYVSGVQLVQDGIIGAKTLGAINDCAVVKLLSLIASHRKDHYQVNSSAVDLNGLYRRAEGWQLLVNSSSSIVSDPEIGM
ncbi:MAG: hypothetical protein KGI50_06655 [Patescibacteria group bacterium]|nr:hypothetical protein [Patescibacteria group bacterium]MDE2439107.1 hypothetical protein [Patescibacteria group bacterium]